MKKNLNDYNWSKSKNSGNGFPQIPFLDMIYYEELDKDEKINKIELDIGQVLSYSEVNNSEPISVGDKYRIVIRDNDSYEVYITELIRQNNYVYHLVRPKGHFDRRFRLYTKLVESKGEVENDKIREFGFSKIN